MDGLVSRQRKQEEERRSDEKRGRERRGGRRQKGSGEEVARLRASSEAEEVLSPPL